MGDQICKEPCVKDDCIGTDEQKDEIAEFNVPEPITSLPQVGHSGALFPRPVGTATRQSSIHNSPSESNNVNQQMAKDAPAAEKKSSSRLDSSNLRAASKSRNSKQHQPTNSKPGSKTSAKLNDPSEKVTFKQRPSTVEPAVWNEVSDASGSAIEATRHQRGKMEPKACKQDVADTIENATKLQGGKDETQVSKKDALDILAEAKKYAAGVPEHLLYTAANESVAALEIPSASCRQTAWALCEALWARAAEKAATEQEAWPRLDFKRNLADIVAEAEESAATVSEDRIYRAACDSFVAVEVSSAARRQAAWALCDAMWARAAEKGAKEEESWHLFA